MNILILLLSPAVICAQRYRKSANPNDEPFLPIHPEYPYSPKLMKRGIEQQPQQQSQALAQLTPELYAPKVDARDSYSASYSQAPYYPSYDPYTKSATAAVSPNTLTTPPYYPSSYSSAYNSNPYSLLNLYGSSYSSNTPGYSANTPSFAAPPYPATGAYPNYYYPPYYYPNFYNQPPYPPPPPRYPSKSSKHKDDDDEEDEEDDRRREKSKKTSNHKNRLRDSDRDAVGNQYVDGTNYIISNSKDLDSESSTYRTPLYNQIEDAEVHPRTAVHPKATYRLVSVSNQQPSSDYNSGSNSYIKIQQLEQLMRQALAKLLAQNAAQQANLAQIQQAVTQQQSKDNSQYISVPNTIAKTGLSYVVNPTILNRVNPGEYNPSQLIQTQPIIGGNKPSYVQKSATSVTLQQSPGIYIPPNKNGNDHSSPSEYDYDGDSATARSQPSISSYQATAEPHHARNSYSYSTYRPTQQTSLDDVNFGSKQKPKS